LPHPEKEKKMCSTVQGYKKFRIESTQKHLFIPAVILESIAADSKTILEI